MLNIYNNRMNQGLVPLVGQSHTHGNAMLAMNKKYEYKLEYNTRFVFISQNSMPPNHTPY